MALAEILLPQPFRVAVIAACSMMLAALCQAQAQQPPAEGSPAAVEPGKPRNPEPSEPPLDPLLRPLPRLQIVRPERARIVIWPVPKTAMAKPSVEKSWRTSFGAERRTDPLRTLRPVSLPVDIVILTGARDLRAVRKLFPPRHFFLIVPRGALARRRAIGLRARGAVRETFNAVAIRRRAGFRLSGRRAFFSDRGPKVSRAPSGAAAKPRQVAMAVRIAGGAKVFWFVLVDDSKLCPQRGGCDRNLGTEGLRKWLTRPLNLGEDITFVWLGGSAASETTGGSDARTILQFGDAATASGKGHGKAQAICPRSPLSLLRIRGKVRAPEWRSHVRWEPSAAKGACALWLNAKLGRAGAPAAASEPPQ